MATMCKTMEKATEILQHQCSAAQKENETLSARLQQTEAQLQAAQDQFPT